MNLTKREVKLKKRKKDNVKKAERALTQAKLTVAKQTRDLERTAMYAKLNEEKRIALEKAKANKIVEESGVVLDSSLVKVNKDELN